MIKLLWGASALLCLPLAIVGFIASSGSLSDQQKDHRTNHETRILVRRI